MYDSRARSAASCRQLTVAQLRGLPSYLISIGVAVVPEPQPQELLVDVLRLQPLRMTPLVAVRKPIPAGVGSVYLRERSVYPRWAQDGP